MRALKFLTITCGCMFLCSSAWADDPKLWTDDVVSELRLGALDHDAGVFSNTHEKGMDVNAEVLFTSPEFLSGLWSPRPHLGAKINTDGDTDQVYGGLTWSYNFTHALFGEFSFGGSAHNGDLTKSNPGRTALGSPVLFRESLSMGWRLDRTNSLSIMLDHISNGGLAKYNGGMEDIGLCYGHHF